MGHSRQVCVCGKVIDQCRCIGPHTTTIISPCTHKAVFTTATPVDKPFNFDTLAMDYYLMVSKKDKEPSYVKMSQIAYDQLVERVKSLVAYDSMMKEGIVIEGEIEVDPKWTLFGLDIRIDDSLEPGEWEFVYDLDF